MFTCMKVLAAYSKKLNKLKRNLDTVNADFFFQ